MAPYRPVRLSRRGLICGAAAIMTAPPLRAEPITASWDVWRSKFLGGDGSVIDVEQGQVRHSEAQGYGLLLAQFFRDHTTFDAIERWVRSHLLIRNDDLMAWRPDGTATHWHNATDGDILRAWALMRAENMSGWRGYLDSARRAARAVEALCLADDPRAPDRPVVLPGVEFASGPDVVPLNPSYIIPRALRELGTMFDLPRLVRAADYGETLLAELAQLGPIPDWICIGRHGFAALPDQPLISGYDAVRVPLYLCWSHRGYHPAVLRVASDLRASTIPGHLAIERGDNGEILAESNLPGYQSILRLAEGRPPALEVNDVALQSYFPATLQILANVAWRESS